VLESQLCHGSGEFTFGFRYLGGGAQCAAGIEGVAELPMAIQKFQQRIAYRADFPSQWHHLQQSPSPSWDQYGGTQ
jgi:hypothetical protein